MSSNCLWPEPAGAVNDNHQVNDSMAICGPGRLSGWEACLHVPQSVRAGETDMPSSLSQALSRKTATLQMDRPPAFLFYLPSPTTCALERI